MGESYYKEMDEDAFDVVVKYTKAKELIQVKDYHRVGGRIDMCEALTTLIEEGKAKGKIEGNRVWKTRRRKRIRITDRISFGTE